MLGMTSSAFGSHEIPRRDEVQLPGDLEFDSILASEPALRAADFSWSTNPPQDSISQQQLSNGEQTTMPKTEDDSNLSVMQLDSDECDAAVDRLLNSRTSSFSELKNPQLSGEFPFGSGTESLDLVIDGGAHGKGVTPHSTDEEQKFVDEGGDNQSVSFKIFGFYKMNPC